MAPSKPAALSLYRRLLRAARHWQGSAEEAEYIRTEARKKFRAGAGLVGEEAAQALEEGEKRLELALHYGIAWPRLFHADQFARVPYVQAPQQAEPEAVASGIRDQGTAAKLAAAARRRKERLARQQQQQPEGRAA